MFSAVTAAKPFRAGENASSAAECDIAVVIPCLDEAPSIRTVIEGFRESVPAARIVVGDNASTDDTALIAEECGALVFTERRPGKGHVVQRLFADVDADVYVLVDGDGTYDPQIAPELIDLVVNHGYDMAIGVRSEIGSGEGDEFRRGHKLGNRLFSAILRRLFRGDFQDVFSGYRVMSRRFVKSFPSRSTGFDIETEITAHATELGATCVEVSSAYGTRSGQSESKLRTYRDGAHIARRTVGLYKELRPLRFFGALSLASLAACLALGIPIVVEFAETGAVPRFPTAILATAIGIIAFLLLAVGLILDSVSCARIEARRIAYLAIPGPVITGREGEAGRAAAPEPQGIPRVGARG